MSLINARCGSMRSSPPGGYFTPRRLDPVFPSPVFLPHFAKGGRGDLPGKFLGRFNRAIQVNYVRWYVEQRVRRLALRKKLRHGFGRRRLFVLVSLPRNGWGLGKIVWERFKKDIYWHCLDLTVLLHAIAPIHQVGLGDRIIR